MSRFCAHVWTDLFPSSHTDDWWHACNEPPGHAGPHRCVCGASPEPVPPSVYGQVMSDEPVEPADPDGPDEPDDDDGDDDA